MDGAGQLSLEYNGYIRALEDERRKIQMFERELPLSLEIVTQAIQAWKQLSLHHHADFIPSTIHDDKSEWLTSLKLNLQVQVQEEELTAGERKEGRRHWSPELHRTFLNAIQQLGGLNLATPKKIRQIMKVNGLTNDEVKSHLQKYRLQHSRHQQESWLSVGNGFPSIKKKHPRRRIKKQSTKM